MNPNDLWRIIKSAVKIVNQGKKNPITTSWKYGKSVGILLRAYYDTLTYGNATRVYSEKQIMEAARYMGIEE